MSSNITEGTFNSSLADNSNRVIAPDYHSHSRVFTLQSGGDWDNHPRGEYVLPCREHLSQLSGIIDNWEFISNNIPQDSPSDKLNTYVQMALLLALSLNRIIEDICLLYYNPDYPCPEDYKQYNQQARLNNPIEGSVIIFPPHPNPAQDCQHN
jgi:hypothetical protein